MGRWLAIVNPAAAAFRSSTFRNRWMPRIEECIPSVVRTTGPRHATELASSATDYDCIAVVGGDGTIYEALNGIDRARQRLAIIPAGRGNNLAQDLCVDEIAVALASISDGQTTKVDLLELVVTLDDGSRTKWLAASTIAVGYATSVVERANRRPRFGKYSYLLAASLTRPSRLSLKVSYENGDWESRGLTGLIINKTRCLADFCAFPRASLSDGMLHVMELNVGWVAQGLHNLSALTRLRVYEPCRFRNAGSVRLQQDEPTTLLVDGELIRDVVGVDVRCCPEAISCQRSSGG